ncbi:MAG: FHA domain-containing protein [Deltaproteobacteria bacterium]|nr:FHA domain-containing protein [Nannocystaceae bacterium]
MDRTIAAARHETSPGHAVHLRLAGSGSEGLEGGEGPTRVFWPAAASEDSTRSPLCHGGGTASTDTTITITAVDAEPAPAALAEQAPLRMEDLIDVDTDDVREVLEGRLELESSRPDARAPGMITVVRAPATEATQIAATVLRRPAEEGTRVATTVLRDPAAEGTRVAATVLRTPEPAQAPARTDASPRAPGVPSPVAAPTRSDVVATEPRDVTSVRMVHTGNYLGDAIDGESVQHRVGSSLVLARTPGSPFEDDPYVEAQHGALTFRPDGVVIDDFDATNGVFVRVRGTVSLRSGDLFRIGEELLRYVAIKAPTSDGRAAAFGSPDPGYWGRIDVLLTPDVHAASYPIDDAEIVLGQDNGHLQFPDDPFLCGQHARLRKHERGAVLEDLASETGTWLRLRSGDVVPYGSELLVGTTRLLLEYG